jgi:hypothetical protein
MAGLGHREWIPGEIITADNVQGYLQDQAVQVYATTAARGSALAIPTEGMVTFLKDAGASQGRFDYFDGSSWKPLVFTPTNSTVSASATLSAGSSITITVPDVLGVNERVDILRDGTGLVNIAAGTGVTTWAGAGASGTANVYKLDQQYNAATVLKIAANSYRVIGKVTI